MTKTKVYQFAAVIQKVPDLDGAYVEFPYDRRAEFGRGRLKVHATFDGDTYDGSIVNMGLTNLLIPSQRPALEDTLSWPGGR